MSGTRKIILGAVAILSLMSGMAPAFADQGGGNRGRDYNNKGHQESDNSYVRKSYDGHGNNNNSTPIRIYEQDRVVLSRYAQDHYKKYCPPGLAKKYGECLQHGKPQKRYQIGNRLPKNVLYYPVPRDVIVNLRPVPSGYQYVRVDNDVLLMNTATKQIIDAVTLLVSANR